MRSLLRRFGLHGDVNDAHRAGANRLKNNKKTNKVRLAWESTPRWVRAFQVGTSKHTQSRAVHLGTVQHTKPRTVECGSGGNGNSGSK